MPTAIIDNALAEFQTNLIGKWSNEALPGARNGDGSRSNPLSYNVMPLPSKYDSTTSPGGYILKNFTFYEECSFDGESQPGGVVGPPPTTAPNRAVKHTQLGNAIYYQQQVFFAEGPGKDSIVHTENGAWLDLVKSSTTLVGPYDDPVVDEGVPPYKYRVAKEMAIPHGNSILALGNSDVFYAYSLNLETDAD